MYIFIYIIYEYKFLPPYPLVAPFFFPICVCVFVCVCLCVCVCVCVCLCVFETDRVLLWFAFITEVILSEDKTSHFVFYGLSVQMPLNSTPPTW